MDIFGMTLIKESTGGLRRHGSSIARTHAFSLRMYEIRIGYALSDITIKIVRILEHF
jgi:hypothetical protein